MANGSADVPATDFAITTVNVPDRLDLRDMDDRKQVEDDSRMRGFDPIVLRTWLPRITITAILIIVAVVLWQVFDAWRYSLSPEPLSNRLSASLGVPVKVEGSSLTFAPTPRLVIGKLTINNDVVLSRVEVFVTTRRIAQAFHGGGLKWAELAVGPSSVSVEQGHDLMQLLPKLDGALPKGVGLVRFSDLQFPGQPWLKGSWQLELDRGVSGFAKVSAIQTTGGGTLQVDITPESPETVDFQLLAQHWVLPFGMKKPVEAASAEGKVSFAQLSVDRYSVSGPFGEIHGTVSGEASDGWKVSGLVQSDGLDVDALLREIAPSPKRPDSAGDAEGGTPIAQGMASFNGRFDGKGATLDESVAAATLMAQVSVRSALLNGINLGFIAMNPGANPEASGGSTRFSSLEANIVATSKKFTVRELRARAGALLALGEVDVAENNDISGTLHVDLGTTRVLAPIRVRVHGTLAQPKFGR
jgi:hypothetical protein